MSEKTFGLLVGRFVAVGVYATVAIRVVPELIHTLLGDVLKDANRIWIGAMAFGVALVVVGPAAWWLNRSFGNDGRDDGGAA